MSFQWFCVVFQGRRFGKEVLALKGEYVFLQNGNISWVMLPRANVTLNNLRTYLNLWVCTCLALNFSGKYPCTRFQELDFRRKKLYKHRRLLKFA